MNGTESYFEDLLMRVLEGIATEEEFATFSEIIRIDTGLRRRYVREMRLHALLCCQGEAKAIEYDAPVCAARLRRTWPEIGAWGRRGLNWIKIAAAAAVLISGAAIWYAADISAPCESCGTGIRACADPVLPAVRLVSQKGVKGLNLPATVPGTLRIESGEVVVRLDSGVRLALIGPANVVVQHGLRVELEGGRLLADVPQWATGFTVRTRALEIRDLGTVFGVQVGEDVSDVFVFQGRVQVNETGYGGFGHETSGGGVGICEAGEGVRAGSGESPLKFAADWTDAEKLFASVYAGRAFHDPTKALATAMRIADLWAERCMPGSNPVDQKVRIGKGLPFQKQSWVRTTVPQQEVTTMNKASAAAVLTAAAMAAGVTGAVSLEPISVNTSPTENRRWETVFTNEVNVAWRWDNTNAVIAELSVRGMGGEVLVTNVSRAVSNVLWRAFAETTPSEEEVYGLTLTFYDSGGGAAVGVLTSRLAVVKGAFGKATVDPSPAGESWGKVHGNVVIPYDAGWANATAAAVGSQLVIAKTGGPVQTHAFADAAGYFGWKLKNSEWGYGTFNLALAFPEAQNEWDATLIRPVEGIIIRLR